MAPTFQNPFTKRERERKAKEKAAIEAQQRQLKQLQEQTKHVARQMAGSKGPEPQPQHVDPTILLSKGQDQLLRIRDLHPSDLEAFPLLNEAQRIAQQLRDGLNRMPDAGREIWQFQIKEMEDEIRVQTERIMAGAAALPAAPENPRPQARSSSASGPKPAPASKSPFRQVISAFPLSTAARPTQMRPNAPPQRSGNGQQGASGTRSQRRSYQPPGLDNSAHTLAPPPMTYAGQQPMVPPRAAQFAKALPPGGAQVALNQTLGMMPAQYAPGVSGPLTAAAIPDAAGNTGQPTASPWVAKPGALDRQPSGQHILPRQSEEDIFRGLQLGGTPTAVQATTSGLTATQSQVPTPGSPWSIPSSSPRISLQPTGTSHDQPDQSGTGLQGPRPFHTPSAGNLGLMVDAAGSNNKTAELMSKGLSFSMARRLSGNARTSSSNSSSSNSHWSAGMTAAAAAAYAAQSGVSVTELATKKVIKKKTRGVKVGYGQEEEEVPVEVSHVIPGQPMPGPQYLAQVRQQQQQQQAQTVQAADPTAGSTSVEQGSLQAHLQDPHVQALIAQRQAIFQAHQSVMVQQQQQQQGGPAHVPSQPVLHNLATSGRTTPTSGTAQPSHLLAPTSPHALGSSAGSVGWPGSPQAMVAQLQQGLGQPSQAVSQPGTEPPAFVIRSQDPLQDLNSYLDQLTGPLHACQQAATVAAATIVQTLSGTARAALSQHLVISERSRVALQQLSTLTAQLRQLEEQQTERVAQEEFEAAATLDVQIRETGRQLDTLQATLCQMRAAASQLCERHTHVLTLQAEACTTVSAYLTKLGDNHARLLEQMSHATQQESGQTGAAHAQAVAAIDEARAALAQQKVQLTASLEELDSRVHASTAELQIERNEVSARQLLLQSELQQLRAALAEREASLQACVSALQQIDGRIQAATTQLQEAKQQVHARQQQLLSQEQLLDQKAAQAAALQASSSQRVAGQTAHNQALVEQGAALQEAAQRLQGMAARISTRVTLDKQAVEEREQLRQAADQAHDTLQEHIRRFAECEAQQANFDGAVARAQAQLTQLQTAAVTAASSLPALGAAKDAAAAARDFKEAARLHTQIKSIQQQVDTLQAQAQQAEAMVAKLKAEAQSGHAELSSLKAGDQGVRRTAALTRYRYLVTAARSHTRQMQGAGITQELLQALKAEVELETAEAQQLQLVWGFSEQLITSTPAIEQPVGTLSPGAHELAQQPLSGAPSESDARQPEGSASPGPSESGQGGRGSGPLSPSAATIQGSELSQGQPGEDEAFSTPRQANSPSHEDAGGADASSLAWRGNALYNDHDSPKRN